MGGSHAEAHVHCHHGPCHLRKHLPNGWKVSHTPPLHSYSCEVPKRTVAVTKGLRTCHSHLLCFCLQLLLLLTTIYLQLFSQHVSSWKDHSVPLRDSSWLLSVQLPHGSGSRAMQNKTMGHLQFKGSFQAQGTGLLDGRHHEGSRHAPLQPHCGQQPFRKMISYPRL